KDRQNARYFTLNHLLADPRPLEHVSQQRKLLAALLRHLSGTKGRLLHPVDDLGTVFRVDLPTLGWDQQPFHVVKLDEHGKTEVVRKSSLKLFDLVLLEYPYGILPAGSELSEQLTREFLAQAMPVRPIPAVRADWFIYRATMRPLYQELLGTPSD